MRLTLALLLFLTAGIISCNFSCNSGDVIRGSGSVIKQERTVEAYDQIALRGSMDVEWRRGTENKIVVEAEDNLMSYIRTSVENGKLVIETQSGVNIKTRKDIHVYLESPGGFNLIDLAGSGNIKLKDRFESSGKVAFTLSGSGNIVAEVDAPEVKANLVGSGNIELDGRTKDFTVLQTGSGNIDGKDLKAENVKIDATGSGDIDVFSSIKLSIDSRGSGNISYDGKPEINSKMTGSGSFRKR
jgi:Putative auto-transporter adhesin, head GIN domain